MLYRDALARGFSLMKIGRLRPPKESRTEMRGGLLYRQVSFKIGKITVKIPEGLDVRPSGTLFFTTAVFNE